MARRPSTVSVSSLSSSTTTGLSKLAQLPPIRQSRSVSIATSGDGSESWLPFQKVSLGASMQSMVQQNGDMNGFNMDELFTKHTVSEVRTIQQRLRADADAKQEELRLMVGERYRDLLQASTSIIEIAQSSNNVLHAFEEMRSVASSAGPSYTPELVAGQEDAHLQTLQSLSAHMKLLLDAPEHLWRLMEKKRYLHAAWLFLLSRVVHQALLLEDEDDSEWPAYGIHVSEQFPLVQRQWDIVAQFRTQITHKATLFLREHTLSSSDVCAALLTLHLLESRPLSETITIFLTQRTRALTSMLSRPRLPPNGWTSDGSHSTDRPDTDLPHRSKTVLRGIRQKLEAVLQVVSQTLGTTRTVFLGNTSNQASLMSEVLRYISTESSPADWLPVELRLTTQALLTNLPSSTHYGLLPSNIKGYKPYIDDTPLTSSNVQVQLEEQMRDWFQGATQELDKAVEGWFVDLSSIRDVWVLRSSIRGWLKRSEGLGPDERSFLGITVNDWCRKHARRVWRSAISTAESTFRQALSSTLDSIQHSRDSDISGVRTAQHLFQQPPILPLLQTNVTPSVAMASFEKYRQSLQRQILGRTPPLNNVLEPIENRIRMLHDDLNVMNGNDENSRMLASQLLESYRHDAGSLCKKIVNALEESLTSLADATDDTVKSIVFVGQVAAELSSATALTTYMGCSPEMLKAFKANTGSLHDRTLERWREFAVQEVIRNHWSVKNVPRADAHRRCGPSPAILTALLSLSTSMQDLNSSLDHMRRRTWTIEILHTLVQAILNHPRNDGVGSHEDSIQVYWDLCFLLQICLAWDDHESAAYSSLHGRILQLQGELPSEATQDVLDSSTMSEQLSKMQLLFLALLPPSALVPPSSDDKVRGASNLLRFGVPSPGSQYEPAVDIVKPASRLGLLLVGS